MKCLQAAVAPAETEECLPASRKTGKDSRAREGNQKTCYVYTREVGGVEIKNKITAGQPKSKCVRSSSLPTPQVHIMTQIKHQNEALRVSRRDSPSVPIIS